MMDRNTAGEFLEGKLLQREMGFFVVVKRSYLALSTGPLVLSLIRIDLMSSRLPSSVVNLG